MEAPGGSSLPAQQLRGFCSPWRKGLLSHRGPVEAPGMISASTRKTHSSKPRARGFLPPIIVRAVPALRVCKCKFDRERSILTKRAPKEGSQRQSRHFHWSFDLPSKTPEALPRPRQIALDQAPKKSAFFLKKKNCHYFSMKASGIRQGAGHPPTADICLFTVAVIIATIALCLPVKSKKLSSGNLCT